jgi:hypothetical protein
VSEAHGSEDRIDGGSSLLVVWALRIVMPRNRNGTEHSKTLLSPVKIAYMRAGRLRAAT